MGLGVCQGFRVAARPVALLSLGAAFALASGAAYGSPSAPGGAAALQDLGNEQSTTHVGDARWAAQSGQDGVQQSGEDAGDDEDAEGDKDEEELVATTFRMRSALQPLQAGAGCSYADAGTGAYAQTLCWLNFAGFTHTSGTTSYPVSIPLPGGYTFTANLTATGGRAVSEAFPTWTGSFLGNRGFYTGVQGKPALYQTADKTTTTLRLENIRVTNASGQRVSGYGLVVADAESTDSGESITWTTDAGNFQLLPNSPTSNYGNACNSFTNSSGTAKCNGPGGSPKTGTVMLSTTAPANKNFYVQQVLVGGGKQGVAFGVMFATVRAEVEIQDRIDASDQFGVSFTTSQTAAVTANTGGTLKDADTGVYSLLANPNQELSVTMAETVPAGAYHDSYAREWSCARTNPANPNKPWEYNGTTPPPANNATSKVSYGQAVSCKLKLTPPYLELDKSVVDPEGIASGELPSPNNWTLTASGPKGVSGAGGVSKTPVPVGTYTLSEEPAANFGQESGFELTGWACEPKAAQNGQVQIGLGDSLSCTATNQPKRGGASWRKVAAGSGEALAGSQWTLTGPGVPESTKVSDCTEGPCPSGPYQDLDPDPGKFRIEGLKWGEHTLKEAKAPAGYVLEDTTHHFWVGEQTNDAFNIAPDWGAIENTQQTTPSIPVTGGIGRDQVYFAMATVLGLGLILLGVQQGRSRRTRSASTGRQ